jgi:NADH:ubiquinone oxidoreductase subunit 6 (subunit J)
LRLRNPNIDEKFDQTFKVGCFGCLMYIFLFFSVGGFFILLGYDYYIMASILVLAFFVLIWFISFRAAYRSDRKKQKDDWIDKIEKGD